MQVQFDEWQDSKPCTLIINDDHVFEGPETLYLELRDPTYTLLGSLAKMTITIFDLEDGQYFYVSLRMLPFREGFDVYGCITLYKEIDLVFCPQNSYFISIQQVWVRPSNFCFKFCVEESVVFSYFIK